MADSCDRDDDDDNDDAPRFIKDGEYLDQLRDF